MDCGRAKALKIVRVIARLNIGGPARHVTLLADGLHAHGYDTTVIYGEPEASEGSFDDLLNRDINAIKLRGLGRRLRPWSDLRVFVQLLRIMFREHPDIVHTHTAKAGVLGRVAAAAYNATRPRHSRALVVHTFHGHVLDGYFSRRANRAVRTVERALAYLSDCIVAIAPHQRDDLVERFHIAPKEKVYVVRLGLDLAPLLEVDSGTPSLKSELGWGEDDLVFGYVGRLVPIKDVDLLLQAFAQVVSSVPSARLAIAGEGTERRQLEYVSAHLRLASRVAFLGWRRDLPRLYRTFDVAVLSSRNEGTPVALIEAMAAKLPVVALRVGGVPDVVIGGRTGLLVEGRDVDRLARAMIQLATDGDARRRMGDEGRSQVAKKYSVNRLVFDLDRLYRAGLQVKRGEALAPLPSADRNQV